MSAEMIPVASSMVSAVGYEGGVLRVTYHNGRTYEHPGVSEREWEDLLAAPSIGKYLNNVIKPRHPHRG